nr:rep protein [Cressdnaviricota sp.]
MSDTSTVEHSGGGNTKSPPKRNRGWCFTLNNYTESELENITQYFKENCEKHIIGIEKGKENGTPHLQGWCYFKNGVSFKRVKGISERAHWEVAKGSAEQNKNYCSKESVHSTQGIVKLSWQEEIDAEILEEEYKDVVWREWQQKIFDIIETKRDRRVINWIVDLEGNGGKSFLCMYLSITQSVILADGKKADVYHQILTAKNEKRRFDIILLDVPRASLEYVNYDVLEKIKSGLIFSGKYEGGFVRFKPVHLFVFANEYPNMDKLSKDRWNIIEINQNNLDHLEL